MNTISITTTSANSTYKYDIHIGQEQFRQQGNDQPRHQVAAQHGQYDFFEFQTEKHRDGGACPNARHRQGNGDEYEHAQLILCPIRSVFPCGFSLPPPFFEILLHLAGKAVEPLDFFEQVQNRPEQKENRAPPRNGGAEVGGAERGQKPSPLGARE